METEAYGKVLARIPVEIAFNFSGSLKKSAEKTTDDVSKCQERTDSG